MSEKNDNFDEFVKNLQQEIIQKEIEDFNEYIVNLFQNPPNWGKPLNADITIFHSFRGPCGDLMEFFLNIKDNKIIKANFTTDGCGASVAAGSQTTLLIEGKSLNFAQQLTPEMVDKALGGLPKEHQHCAQLAINTLQGLLEKYKKGKVSQSPYE